MDREWLISIVQKYIIILLLPFYLSIGPSSGYACVLFQVGDVPTAFTMPWAYNLFSMVIFILVFTWPALSFDYIQHKRPRHRSVGGVFLLAFLLSSPVIQWLTVGFIGAYILYPIGLSFLISYPLIHTIEYTMFGSQWALAVMIAIPYLIRQLNGLEHPKECNDSGIISTTKSMISRLSQRSKLVPIILGTSVLLMPTLFIPDLADPFRGLEFFGLNSRNWLLLSGSCVIEQVPLHAPELVFSLMSSVINASILFSILFYMVFAKHVLGYLVGRVSRRRCVVSGTAATFTTALVRYIPLPHPWMPSIEYVAYPLPFILILGLAIVWRLQPVHFNETPWDEKPVPAEREQPDVSSLPLLSVTGSKLRKLSPHPEPSYRKAPEDEIFADSFPHNESDESQ